MLIFSGRLRRPVGSSSPPIPPLEIHFWANQIAEMRRERWGRVALGFGPQRDLIGDQDFWLQVPVVGVGTRKEIVDVPASVEYKVRGDHFVLPNRQEAGNIAPQTGD